MTVIKRRQKGNLTVEQSTGYLGEALPILEHMILNFMILIFSDIPTFCDFYKICVGYTISKGKYLCIFQKVKA